MEPTPRLHRTAAQWHALIRQFETSGLSRAAFCREQNLSYPSFCLWHNRLAGQRAELAPTESLFAPLAVAPAPLHTHPDAHQPVPFGLTLRLGSWLTLEVHAGVRVGHRE